MGKIRYSISSSALVVQKRSRSSVKRDRHARPFAFPHHTQGFIPGASRNLTVMPVFLPHNRHRSTSRPEALPCGSLELQWWRSGIKDHGNLLRGRISR